MGNRFSATIPKLNQLFSEIEGEAQPASNLPWQVDRMA